MSALYHDYGRRKSCITAWDGRAMEQIRLPGLPGPDCLLALQVIVWVEGRKGTLIYFTFAAPEKGWTACRKYEL